MPRGTVLIVEDELMLQLLWEDVCELSDVKVGGVAASVAEAMACLDDQEFGAVILDVNLRGETSDRVAERLSRQGIPVLVSTGSHSNELSTAFHGMLVIEKPYGSHTMLEYLERLF